MSDQCALQAQLRALKQSQALFRNELEVAAAEQACGVALFNAHRLEEALPHMREALRGFRLCLHDTDMRLADAELAMGATLHDLDRHSESVPHRQQAI